MWVIASDESQETNRTDVVGSPAEGAASECSSNNKKTKVHQGQHLSLSLERTSPSAVVGGPRMHHKRCLFQLAQTYYPC